MKKILALVLAALMVLSMVACAKTETDDSIVIKVWTPTEDQDGQNWLGAMEEKFLAAHPEYSNVKFENTTMGEGEAGAAVVADVTASADVFMFANDQLGKLVNAGGLSELAGVYADQVKNDNSDFMINSVTHTDGKLYGFPVTNNTWFMYYDKSVFTAEDVVSLEKMLEVCAEKDKKIYLPFGTGWTAGCIFLGCGATIFGEAGNDAAAGIDFGGEKGYTAAKKMIELVESPYVIAGGMSIEKVVSGEASVTFTGSWDYAKVEAALKDNLGVAALPKFTADGNEYRMTAMSGSKCVGVNPNSGAVEGKQEIATAFAAFLASEEAQLARYEMRGAIPAHKNLKTNEKIAADPVAVAEMDTIANASVVQSALPGLDNYWGPVETFGNKIVTKEYNMENYTLEVDNLQKALNGQAV